MYHRIRPNPNPDGQGSGAFKHMKHTDGADGGHQEVTHFMDTWSNVIPRGSVVIQEDALQGRS